MKKLIALIVIICTFSTLNAQEKYHSELDTFFDKIEKSKSGIGSISIAKNGITTYSRNFGQINNSSNQANKEFVYHVGSITKMLTAIISFQLFDENRLDLNQKIEAYLPTIPNANKITIANLIGHTSGLGDYALKNDSLYFWLKQPASQDDILNEIIRQGVLFQAGDNTKYSNSGYYLLNYIVERENNKTFHETLSQRITSPLKLKYTKSYPTNQTNAEKSYQINTNGEWEEIEDFYFPNVVGVGNVVSTPNEMNTIIHSLFSSKLIKPTTLEIMKPDEKSKYGKGLIKFPFYDNIFYGHGGVTYGTYSIVIYNEADATAISICLNGQAITLNDILIGVMSMIYGKEYQCPSYLNDSPKKISVSNLKSYEGVYGSADLPLKFTVFNEANNLMIQVPKQLPIVLEGLSNNKFRSLPNKIEVEFDVEQNQLILTQHGKKISLKRVD